MRVWGLTTHRWWRWRRRGMVNDHQWWMIEEAGKKREGQDRKLLSSRVWCFQSVEFIFQVYQWIHLFNGLSFWTQSWIMASFMTKCIGNTSFWYFLMLTWNSFSFWLLTLRWLAFSQGKPTKVNWRNILLVKFITRRNFKKIQQIHIWTSFLLGMQLHVNMESGYPSKFHMYNFHFHLNPQPVPVLIVVFIGAKRK